MTASHRPRTGALRALLTGLVTGLAATVATVSVAAPAPAAEPAPGAFTGYAFDARCAPTQSEMDAWLTSSPFWGVGVYLGGSTMSCRPDPADPASGQPHLDATWVSRQTAAGWRLLPLWVGPQASCSSYADRIDPTSTDAYAAADAQGRVEAAAAVQRARALGIARGSTLWYDLEGGFDLEDTDCRRSALRFLSGWTSGLHALGHRSGVYSNIADGIHALDNADNLSAGSYEMPDQVWFAWANGRADTVFSDKVRAGSWTGERVHQYALDQSATYGGVTLAIDRNFLQVGGGSVAPRAPRACGGVRLDRADYPSLAKGRRGAVVEAAQCLLKQRGSYRGRVDGRFDRDVAAAVRGHQRARDLSATGRVDRRTWTSLLAAGSGPLLKVGSAEDAVRRLQRALNVATTADLRVTGVLDDATSRWVATYQRRVGRPVTGVVAADTWTALRAGRV
ncbi:glycoside hydrolase domain-containing protein [Nocardioides sp. NPDC092400]|uniref:glycoside hydrolase domain-containing protein n=1 Tax=Nocardioides sp. NPDC092400 TaxID=3155196 RepID=UPI0034399704